MRITKAKRKLIHRVTMYKLWHQTNEMGVPLARACKNLGIDISRPVATKLLHYYNAMQVSAVFVTDAVEESLFPPWLLSPGVSENPDNWAYAGNFPFGHWVEL